MAGSDAKETNIQVVVRIRPRSDREKKENSAVIVQPARETQFSASPASFRELNVQQTVADKPTLKSFQFDRVFGPESSQYDVFGDVVSPLLDEVLAGYNCTVFAYGQSGTGKTFTMEGDLLSEPVPLSPGSNVMVGKDAGVIPRTLFSLFEYLEKQGTEYSVRVSYTELYNEELKDLLSPEDDMRKLKVFEDAGKKGTVVIQGLEEILVGSAADVMTILKSGSNKRRVAATKLNENSSRSHAIFSITVHIKESTPDGEELLKVGKLNLVDLAGSENIGRSGAENKRAREAGNINQSLLSLGRVINALVERSPHVPYRESKLTRILQDSLGGKTKTCIIATVSPARINLEETLSTLDYAYRAKNIRNRPEANQRLTKRALIREYAEEIERLKSDLQAARDKNGIFLSDDTFNSMTETARVQKDRIDELVAAISLKETDMRTLADRFHVNQKMLEETAQELNETKNILTATKIDLNQATETLEVAKRSLQEQKALAVAHAKSELSLDQVARGLVKTLDQTVKDVHGLHEKIERKKTVEEENKDILQGFKQNLKDNMNSFNQSLALFRESVDDILNSHFKSIEDAQQKYSQAFELLQAKTTSMMDNVHSWSESMQSKVAENSKEETNYTAQIKARNQANASSRVGELNAVSGHLLSLGAEQVESFTAVNQQVSSQLESLQETCGMIATKSSNLRLQRLESATRLEAMMTTAVNGEINRLEHRVVLLETALRLEREKHREEKQSLLQQITAFVDEQEKQRDERLDLLLQHQRSSFRASQTGWKSFAEQYLQESKNTAAFDEESVQIQTKQIKQLEENAISDHEKLNTALAKNVSKIEETAKSLAAEVDSIAIKIQSSVAEEDEIASQHLKRLDDITLSLSETAASIVPKMQAGVAELENVIKENVKTSMEDTMDRLAENARSMKCYAGDFVEDSARSVENITQITELTFESQLKEDMPTGTTPHRKDYKVASEWSLARPREVIEEFLRTVEESEGEEQDGREDGEVRDKENMQPIEPNGRARLNPPKTPSKTPSKAALNLSNQQTAIDDPGSPVVMKSRIPSRFNKRNLI